MTTEERDDGLTYKYYATINSAADTWREILNCRSKYLVSLLVFISTQADDCTVLCMYCVYEMKATEWHNKEPGRGLFSFRPLGVNVCAYVIDSECGCWGGSEGTAPPVWAHCGEEERLPVALLVVSTNSSDHDIREKVGSKRGRRGVSVWTGWWEPEHETMPGERLVGSLHRITSEGAGLLRQLQLNGVIWKAIARG